MKTDKISELTTNRLSVYLRCLNDLAVAGIETISSQTLAEQFNLNSAQIRKDLASFGAFGVRGVGYAVNDLRRDLRRILGLDVERRVAIVGLGNLGKALAHFQGFNRDSFRIVALFDDHADKIGQDLETGLLIQDTAALDETLIERHVDIVIIAVPATAAQKVLDRVQAAGVKAVLNFAPIVLTANPDVKVRNVDLSVSLESLSYFLAKPNADESIVSAPSYAHAVNGAGTLNG
jgi:redox-sensing transcriptional repressor